MAEQLSLEQMEQIAVKMSRVPDDYPAMDQRLQLRDVVLHDDHLFVPHGPWHIANHPHKLSASNPNLVDPEVPSPEMPLMPAGLSEKWQSQGLLLDQYGRPIHPHWRQLLADPRTALPTGTGYFYRYGPNATVDAFVYRWGDDGEPEVLLIRRRKGGKWALAGGFEDRDDPNAVFSTRRELGEETGLEEVGGTEERIVHILPIGHLSVLHAWTTNSVYLIHGNQEYLHDVEPVAGDDAIDVGWFTQQAIAKLDIFEDHPPYIKTGIRRVLLLQ